MTTVLAAQLAQVHAQSKNSLDLKAQKQAHSQSLLFNQRVAATQDFDTIYQICYEGFEQLCRLDVQFKEFARNIFHEQSKHQDRTQMTPAQIQQLDVVLVEFLGLVSSKLLLKPALKAVEWLVRRFRVHEHQTLSLVFTFLPLHMKPIFMTLLSILPQKVTVTLKFLTPYIQTLANPPRHAILYAASNSRPFFAAFSANVFQSCRLNCHHPVLTSFWASIATEAVASMLKQARHARLEHRKRDQDDLVLFLLPILNEGLSPAGSFDLRVGCYMVLTILASETNLGDDVLVALMKAVTLDWSRISHAGMICLSMLAQRRHTVNLPNSVFQSVITLEKLEDDLLTLQGRYKVERLTLGLVLGIVDDLRRNRDANRLRLLQTLMTNGLMNESLTTTAIKAVILAARPATPETVSKIDVRGSLADVLTCLAESEITGRLMKCLLEAPELDIDQCRIKPVRSLETNDMAFGHMIEGVSMKGMDKETQEFDAVTSRIPSSTAYEISFLAQTDSYVFSSLAYAFTTLSTSSINIEKFSTLKILRRPLAMREPLYLSFFIRMWCEKFPADARTAAIQSVSQWLAAEPLTCDVQIMLPYLLFALADQSAKVRRAATKLVLALAPAYTKADEKEKDSTDLPTLGQKQIYGRGTDMMALSWLSIHEVHRFLSDLLVPGLEECLLDDTHMCQLLSEKINSKHSKTENNLRKEMKTSVCLAIFNFLCTHIVYTPLYSVKFRLLQMLNRIPKVGTASKTKLLWPLLSGIVNQKQDELEYICRKEEIDFSQFMNQVIGIITAADREGLHILKAIIKSNDQSQSQKLRAAALRHLQSIWSSVKPDLQASFARLLLEQVVASQECHVGVDETAEPLEILRAVPLSVPILHDFIEESLTTSARLQDKSSVSKRRRTTLEQPEEIYNYDAMQSVRNIRRITVVLELVGGAKAGRHPDFLQGLFQVFSHLQYYCSHSSTATSYLQISAMESMLKIIENVENLSNLRLDRSALRADVLVDCIRTTESPQVRNSALLLVSALATTAPELILHNVMPVFTSMGKNVLYQDDDFSAHVVKRIMDSVIPRLLQSLHTRKDGPLVGITELFSGFAAAFEHIPNQRRLDLFQSLVDKVGPSDYLFALLTILLDKYPSDRKVAQFAKDLCARYDVKIRLYTIAKYLEVLVDLSYSQPSISVSLLIIINRHDALNLVANLLSFASVILSDAGPISTGFSKLGNKDEDAVTVKLAYEQILDQVFMLSEHYNSNDKLDRLCERLLITSLGLRPLSELIETLEKLLQHPSPNIRRRILQSFEAQLADKRLDHLCSQTKCLAFLPELVSVIENTTDVSLLHMAIVCLSRIVETFGKKDPPAIVVAAHTICGQNCLAAAETRLQVTSLLCLARMIEASGDAFVPIVPKSLPIAINNLATSKGKGAEDDALHNAAYSFVGALLIYLPWAITGADLDQFLNMSYASANAEMGGTCNQSRIDASSLLPKQIDFKTCLAALDRTWSVAVTEGPLAVKDHLHILRQAIDLQPKSVIAKHSETLGDLFLKMFDLRRIQLSIPTEDSYDKKEVDGIEVAINEIAIIMIYKLNDATFRPLFLRLSDWTRSVTSIKDEQGRVHRQTTWFTFLMKFFETLKSIVTSYAGLIIDDSVEILQTFSAADHASMELWRGVILTLSKTFKYDQDDFYQIPAHFDPVCTALLDQIAHAAQMFLWPELFQAIAELAVATESATHHREMNAKLLKYVRSDSAAVRLAALQCEMVLTERLGEEWLALLPEMLPFISEALEDDDEMVEKEVQRWIGNIEDILGERLDPMLQ